MQVERIYGKHLMFLVLFQEISQVSWDEFTIFTFFELFRLRVECVNYFFKECHPRCVGELDRWEGSQKHNSYNV